MGDEHQRAGPALEEALEPVDRGDVEVVGRLVEQQHVGRRHQRAGEQHAPLHAAGQAREIGVAIEVQAVQRLGDALVQRPAFGGLDPRLHRGQRVHVDGFGVDQVVVLRQRQADVAEAAADHVEHAAGRIGRDFLFQSRHPHAALAAHLAVVRLELAVEQAQQGGFAGAVATDQGNAFAGLDGQVDALEQQRAADTVVDGIQGHQGHAHSLPVECPSLGASPYARARDRSTFRHVVDHTNAENAMSKGLDKKKEDKKKPEKSLKEKRAAKKDKKAGK